MAALRQGLTAGLAHDFRFAARALRRTAAFTAVAAIVLALGIGACSAVFSLLDAALIRPLPFAAPERLLMLWERAPQYAHNRVSPLNFLDWSDEQRAFASIAAIAGGGRMLTGEGDGAERIPGQAVTSRFFDVLGVRPLAGRTFTPDDAKTPAVVVISERLWRGRFGSDPALLGRALSLDGEALTVVGIVPADFRILYRADIWTLFVPRRSPEQRRQHYLQVIGRLRPGVSLDQARADMSGIADRIAVTSPDTNRGWGVTIEPLHDAIVGADLRTTSLVLAGVVGFVLLTACANVANLLLARGLGRAREIAVRAAIGGSRGRIVRQLLVEALLIAAIGGAGGLTLAWAAVRAAPRFLPPDTLPQSIALVVDARLTLIAVALTLLTCLLCGLAPAWHASGAPLTAGLKSGGRAASRGTSRFRSALVIAEIAAAVLVLTGGGLLIRTLLAIDRTDPGYRAGRVLTGMIGLPFNSYDNVERMLAFYRSAEREFARIPGVNAVGIGGSLPLDGFDIGQGFEVVGDPPMERANMPAAHYQIISAGYFNTLGIDLLRGRPFSRFDTAQAKPVCIVNEELVRRHLGGRDPISLLLSVQAMDLHGGPTPVVREIVGVVRNVVEQAGEKQPTVQIYVPITQNPWFSASIALRTEGDPIALAGPLRAAIAKVDKTQAVMRIRTMEEVAAESAAQPRFRARLVGLFAVLALALAAVGISGVLAYSVSQRTREFGIRVALGARTHDVLRLVLRSVVVMTAAGIGIGAGTAALLMRFLVTLLYGVQPLDPLTFFATAGILALTSLTACALPAWRATQLDPIATLRLDS